MELSRLALRMTSSLALKHYQIKNICKEKRNHNIKKKKQPTTDEHIGDFTRHYRASYHLQDVLK